MSLPSLLLALVLAFAPGLDTASARAPSSGYSRPSVSSSSGSNSLAAASGEGPAPIGAANRLAALKAKLG